jgi:hypothetical protein
MARFTDLPADVREQIYAELLIVPAIEDFDDAKDVEILLSSQGQFDPLKHPTESRGHVSTGIMYTNRQLHAESSYFFHRKNLFTCVHLNNHYSRLQRASFVELIHHRCFAVFETAEDIPDEQFAMSLQIATFGQKWDGMHRKQIAFVFPAQALPFLFKYLSINGHIQLELTVAKFNIYNTYRYSLSRFVEHSFGAIQGVDYFPACITASMHETIRCQPRGTMDRKTTIRPKGRLV